jgi:hypothetical protein
MKYTLIVELADGRESETPIENKDCVLTNKDYVLIYFKDALNKMKEGEKISVVTNK